jgi:hypothetical protein
MTIKTIHASAHRRVSKESTVPSFVAIWIPAVLLLRARDPVDERRPPVDDRTTATDVLLLVTVTAVEDAAIDPVLLAARSVALLLLPLPLDVICVPVEELAMGGEMAHSDPV